MQENRSFLCGSLCNLFVSKKIRTFALQNWRTLTVLTKKIGRYEYSQGIPYRPFLESNLYAFSCIRGFDKQLFLPGSFPYHQVGPEEWGGDNALLQ